MAPGRPPITMASEFNLQNQNQNSAASLTPVLLPYTGKYFFYTGVGPGGAYRNHFSLVLLPCQWHSPWVLTDMVPAKADLSWRHGAYWLADQVRACKATFSCHMRLSSTGIARRGTRIGRFGAPCKVGWRWCPLPHDGRCRRAPHFRLSTVPSGAWPCAGLESSSRNGTGHLPNVRGRLNAHRPENREGHPLQFAVCTNEDAHR
jgi:hypothetical protein